MITKKRQIGDVGEDIACKFLIRHGYMIVERNYNRKWGEIDVIATSSGKYCFVEVKTVTRDLNVFRETADNWRAEDNIHPAKLKRLSRTIQSYLLEKDLDGEWQFDVIVVVIDPATIRAKVSHMKGIVL